MQQLTCGIDETVSINGVRVRILEVAGDEVKFGLSLPSGERPVQHIRLSSAEHAVVSDVDGPTTPTAVH
jgi:hypothetical protein